uniref:Uncharacterized protein n=1 Tax=Marseillevirus LCMAC201 TaxID=2506605 RepID=A0A481YVP9_9VIRU|nr:MAG: hypothetical protein LCMAC201_02830 [Marseillevirus LCMAC201]
MSYCGEHKKEAEKTCNYEHMHNKTIEFWSKPGADAMWEEAMAQAQSTPMKGVTITEEEYDEWLASSSNGGLKITELRKKADELGLVVTSKTNKSEIREMMEELIEVAE